MITIEVTFTRSARSHSAMSTSTAVPGLEGRDPEAG
jgi:hypothetical protein